MKPLVLTLLLGFAGLSSTAATGELGRLRQDFARRYFHAEAHLALAKYLAENGDRLTAFAIMEAARREHFPEKEFAAATALVFRNDHFDNSAAAEAKLLASDEPEPHKSLLLADIHLSRSEWKAAEALLRHAMAIDPSSSKPIGVLAEVLKRDGREAEGAEVVRKWQAEHPDALEVWQQKVQAAMEAKADAAPLLAAALEKYPNDGMLHLSNATQLQRNGDLKGAAKEFQRAAELAPDSDFIQGWTARYFFKVMKDDETALRYYLAAYFLDPDFNDGEYAESRIRTIWSRQPRPAPEAGTVVAALGSSDLTTVSNAIEFADQHWSDEFAGPLAHTLASNEESVRAHAADVLGRHATASFRDQLKALLESEDLLVRGSAAYVAGAMLKEKVVPVLLPWLSEDAELIRYDALSVLKEYGGAVGKRAILDYRKSGREKNPRLQEMLAHLYETPQAKAPDE